MCEFWNPQGGNNIHAKGMSCIAEVLKDNDVITTVRFRSSSLQPSYFLLFFAVRDFNLFSSRSWKLAIIQLGLMELKR